MPAFMAQHGMPYWIDLMSSDVRKSAHFYSELLGWEFEEAVPGYRLARCQGLPVAGLIAQPEDSNAADMWVTHFLADDIEAWVGGCGFCSADGGAVGFDGVVGGSGGGVVWCD